jgi:uncharacterized OB-fold protein
VSRIEPTVSEQTREFWDATRDERLLYQFCLECDAVVQYPRARCPGCLGERLEWRESNGRAEVYAVSVQHGWANPFGGDGPYVVALVDLEEGGRLMTNVVDCEVDAVQVGMPVRVTWEALSDGRKLPLFAPLDA